MFSQLLLHKGDQILSHPNGAQWRVERGTINNYTERVVTLCDPLAAELPQELLWAQLSKYEPLPPSCRRSPQKIIGF